MIFYSWVALGQSDPTARNETDPIARTDSDRTARSGSDRTTWSGSDRTVLGHLGRTAPGGALGEGPGRHGHHRRPRPGHDGRRGDPHGRPRDDGHHRGGAPGDGRATLASCYVRTGVGWLGRSTPDGEVAGAGSSLPPARSAATLAGWGHELRIFTEPQQGATYDELLAVARTAEELASTRSSAPTTTWPWAATGHPARPTPGSTLAGLARETSHHPARDAGDLGHVPAAGPAGDQRGPGRPDERRPGRARPGAGWYEREHAAYGIPFPPLGERFDRLEEQFEIMTGLGPRRTARRSPSTGTHYQLEDSPALPKPVQQPAPADHRRRRGRAPHAAAGGPVRRRVQPPLPHRRGPPTPSPGPVRLRGARP